MTRALLVLSALLFAACSNGPTLRCGAGTHEDDGECVPDETSSPDTGVASAPDASIANPDAGIAAKRFFVTSALYDGDLKSAGRAADGLTSADAICQTAATAVNLGGTWKSLISAGTEAAIDRIAEVGPWFDLKGVKVFNNKANLASTPLAALEVDESANEFVLSPQVWTGSKSGAVPSGASCSGWTTNASNIEGTYGAGGTSWLDAQEHSCNATMHLYCIEQ